MLDHDSLVVLTVDRSGTIISTQGPSSMVLGSESEELVGRCLLELIATSERERVANFLDRCHVGEPVVVLRTVWQRTDGTPLSLEVTAVHLDQLPQHATMLLLRDVTTRVDTERELEQVRHVGLLREQEARQRSEFLAQAGQVLSSSLDYETTLATVARLAVPEIADWCSVHIREEDGSVQALATAHIDPARVQLARDLQQRLPFDPDGPSGAPAVLRTGLAELVPEITDDMIDAAIPDPELQDIFRRLGLRSSMVVPLVARGRVLGTITMVAAESGRRFGDDDLYLAEALAARAALAVDNARLYRQSLRIAAEQAATLAQMADAVIIADPGGVVRYMNIAAQRLLGVRDTVALGRTIDDLVGSLHAAVLSGEPVGQGDLILGRALAGEIVTGAERRIRRADGSEMVLQSSAAPVMGDDQVILGAVMTFRDVTAWREMELQKDSFLAAAAHDLKTPLATIKGMAQVLQRRLRRSQGIDPQSLEDGLAQIDTVATRMTRLVNELLDVTRTQMNRRLDLNLRPVDLVALTQRVVEETQRVVDDHQLHVETELPELVGRWDAERLERVLGNLLTNAIKYSPPGRDAVVALGTEHLDGMAWAVLNVQDRGVGIPAEDLPRIFERFYRGRNVVTNIPGTGVGLAGAKQIVEQHGGIIQVESEEGRGTTFTVRLPIVPAVSEVPSGG